MRHFAPVLFLLLVLGVQVTNTLLANDSGLKLWRVFAATAQNESFARLHEGLQWVNQNTSKDSVLIPSSYAAVAPSELKETAVDGATLDKYYYYSALTERRLYIEGPAYLRNQMLAAQRLQNIHINLTLMAAPGGGLSAREYYLLVDKTLPLPKVINFNTAPALYSNDRVSIYRVKSLQ